METSGEVTRLLDLWDGPSFFFLFLFLFFSFLVYSNYTKRLCFREHYYAFGLIVPIDEMQKSCVDIVSAVYVDSNYR